MKYYLLSHALGFDRLFDTLEEISEYVWAKTGNKLLPTEVIEEYLGQHSVYKFSSWGIDIAIFRRPAEEAKSSLPIDTESATNNPDTINDHLK